MVWYSVRAPSFLVKNVLYFVVFIVIVLIRWLLCKVSHTLWFNSSIALMTWLVILRGNIINLYIKRELLETMDYLIVYRLLSALINVTECHCLSHLVCHVQCIMFNLKLLCLNSISFPYWINLIGLSLTTWYN